MLQTFPWRFSKNIKSLIKSFYGSLIRFFMYVDSVKRVLEEGDLTRFSQALFKRFSVTLTYLCQEYLPFNK